MPDWCKRWLVAIEGNAVWVGVCLVIAFLATLLPVSAFKGWLHQPVSNRGIWLWSLFPVAVMSIILMMLRKRKPPINIEVMTDDGLSAERYITIKNHGQDSLFTAECRIEASNRPESYPKGPFRLGWEDGTKANREISQHTSAEVLLASFHDVIPHALFEMNVWKVVTSKRKSQWSMRWDVRETVDLPSLCIRLTIASKGAKEPWEKCFILVPKTSTGPLILMPTKVPA